VSPTARNGGREGSARTVAVVPLRGGTSGKSRLSGVLAEADRAALVVALARHVVGTLLAADDVGAVVVVTADPTFASEALAGLGVHRVEGEADGGVAVRVGAVHTGALLEVVTQPRGAAGLNAAVELGRARAVRADPTARLLAIHADLPALTPQDVAALLAARGAATLAPDRAGTGTNAVVLDPAGTGFTFRFGPGSGAAHREEAARRGIDVAVVRRPGTATDLDTAADWAALPGDVRARVVAQVPAMGRLSTGTSVVP